MSETVTITVLTSRDVTLDFLSRHPDPDETIRWTCPECNAVNDGTYHSHVAHCGACGKGYFPAIPLPIVGDAKTSVRRAFMNDRLSQIKESIEEYTSEISGFEEEISEREGWIRHLEKERDDLKHALNLDKVKIGDVDW